MRDSTDIVQFVFQSVTLDDYQLLLAWRNDPLTRQQSFQEHVVSESEHVAWLKMMIGRSDRHLWLAKIQDRVVGVLRQDEEASFSELSWTVAPECRGKGYGKEMVKQLADMLPGELRATIKPTNGASVHIACFAGFALYRKQEGKHIYRRLPIAGLDSVK